MSSWGIREDNITDYKSVCYVCKKGKPTIDDWGNQLQTYGEPKKYYFNIQPISRDNTSNASAFGELIPRLKCAIIPKTEYLGVFNEFDVAYLDGVEPIDESFYGEKANYRIYSVQPQNTIIKVYFLKIVKGEDVYENEI